MGADDDVYKPPLRVLNGLLLLGRSAETAHQIHPHRELLHPLDKGIVVLLGQDGGWNQVDHLLVLLNRLEGRPDGDLRLPVAHVPADEPVHDLGALHIMLHSLDGRKLVLRLLKGEHLLKLPLPDRVRAVDIALLLLPGRIESHQVLCDLPDRSPHSRPGLCPLLGPQPVQLRLLGVRIGVLLDQIQLSGRDVEVAPLGVGNLHVVLGHLVHLDLLDALVDADAMVFMDHIVSHLQLGEALDLPALVGAALLFLLYLPENVCLRDDLELQQRVLVPLPHVAVGGHDLPRLHLPVHLVAVKAAQIVVPQILRQALCPGS